MPNRLAPARRGRPRRYCSRACQARAYRARKDAGPSGRAATAETAPAPRTPPDRAAIVARAVELADAHGLEAVSMRTLAQASGVPAMSLHRRISGKDDLVAAMVEDVVQRSCNLPAPSRGWRMLLEHEARQEWRLYRRHPGCWRCWPARGRR